MGYDIPQSMEELKAADANRSSMMAAPRGASVWGLVRPTGWPATDWVEEYDAAHPAT